MVAALQFNRTVWKKARKFTGSRIHSLKVSTCQNVAAECVLDGVTVREGDWIVLNEGGAFSVCPNGEFKTQHD